MRLPRGNPALPPFEIVAVDATSLDEHGVYCLKDPRREGFRRKAAWLAKRFQEGLRFKLLYPRGSERAAGFIEYAPAEVCWRPVEGPGYLVIHCLMVGRKRDQRQGYGAALVEDCLAEARRERRRGLAVVTSTGPWLAGGALFRRLGFRRVATAPPSFELLARRLDENAPDPRFPDDWARRLRRHEGGLTLLTSDQCPWFAGCEEALRQSAAEAKLPLAVVQIRSSRQARSSPSAYGVFGLLHDGELLSYHYLSRRRFETILSSRGLR